MTTIEIRNLHKRFGDVQALDGMDFTVHGGEMYGFVGSNGAGKSTTMRIALGVLAADSGEVLLDGQPLDDDSRRRIGYMPEERGLYGKEKILDQLVFLAKLHGVDGAAAKKRGTELLDALGLGERLNDKLDDLSLGNQQRVQLAASLIHDPDILILDEPFSGLDPVAVDVMSTMLTDRARAGVPVIFSSHQLDLVQRLCDRIGIVTRGRMVAEGTVDELRSGGPLRYRVGTRARGWIPAGASLVGEGADYVILETDSADNDQAILQAAMAAGPVHEFTRVVPDLADMFKEVVQ
ncbi:ATP-binding cassette domain-containing protein [Corynebacterium sp. zg912]|uniref:ABC transporter ATP-binding protein n=1 Tax=Corynebacterium wankanglinii TaxID=2735136 RepID=A0A7V8UU78_9CORY|nr:MULTISPECIES: ATP-binding cassette domain-containing protein [Corynebacterium]MBA1837350.1 ABC transporter ATP-binding protein [Corynebacterium wankanglinii]MCR5928811.1 ATP-binding cassette domain-containing protein [Corynebacterium sp. zg912]